MELSSVLDTIVVGQDEVPEIQEKLEYMSTSLYEKLLPFLKRYRCPARDYVELRDMNNIKLFGVMKQTVEFLRTILGGNLIVCPMSSICAKLNLIYESDIDIGILVKDLNLESGKLNYVLFYPIKTTLENNGFKFDHIFNEDNPSNRYYSFVKNTDCTEIEVKVRDYDTSLIFLKLHEKLDNGFSDEEIALITYAKYLMKQHGDISYKQLKKIIYQAMFAQVEGGFLI